MGNVPVGRLSRRRWAAAAGALLLAACHRRRVRKVPGPVSRRTVPPVAVGTTQTGVASWYGHPYHGRHAANGEIYDMEKFTAAHCTLPFDTWVRVKNLSNGKTVEVRITDRGPFVGGRIIDLSRAAARAIDMIGPGTARVRLEVIRAPEGAGETARFAVQVGAFRDRNNAERLRGEMRSHFGEARLVRRDGEPPMWRVLVGSEASEEAARVLAERIRKVRGGREQGFVVRLDSV